MNLGAAHVFGAEFNAGWGIGDDLVIQGGVVVQRARLAEPDPDFGNLDFFRTPRVYGNASIVWRVTPSLRLFAGARQTGTMLVPHRAGGVTEPVLKASPRFLTLDASLSRRFLVPGGRHWVEVLAGMADLRGRVVLIEFWATWCPPCLADIPWLKQARAAHGDRLEIVGVSLDVIDRAALVSWLRRHDVGWRQVYDGRGWSSPAIEPFGFDGIPFNVLVGADGRVVGTDVRGEALLRALDALLR